MIEEVKSSVTEGNPIQRIHLLEKKDLYNIKRDFSINCPTKLHKNDANSIDLWVNEINATKTNCILYYKKQGVQEEGFAENDLILIFMTEFQQEQLMVYGGDKIFLYGTRGPNSYSHLFTVVVVDNFGAAMPAAFCISNRADTELLTMFFKSLKNKVGMVTTTTFMSDEAAFYDAWSSVMGPVKNHLLCTWHVQKDWSQNVNKINNKEKKSLVLKTLKVLQSETEEAKFIQGVSQFTQDLLNDEDTKVFGEYFIKTYSNRVKLWAYCYRKYLSINNTNLEVLHKKLKSTYLEYRKCKRLDKCINALLDLIRDVQFGALGRISKQKLPYKLILIREGHKKSLKMNDSCIKVLEDNKWEITTTRTTYVIEKLTDTCPSNCSLKCSLCNICIHMFKCSCVDNIIHLNICKHIHKVSQKIAGINEMMYTTDFSQSEPSYFDDSDEYMSEAYPEKNDSFDDEIKQKCEYLMDISSRIKLDDHSTRAILKQLDKAIDIIKSREKMIAVENMQQQPIPSSSSDNLHTYWSCNL